MFDTFDPNDRRDERPDEAQLEFEDLEFLPVEEASPAGEASEGGELTFDLPDVAGEPPVTVDPQAAMPDPPDHANEDLDFGGGTPFELLGSSLLDPFFSDDSLDWAFDLDDEDLGE